jgi:hypothetical protein
MGNSQCVMMIGEGHCAKSSHPLSLSSTMSTFNCTAFVEDPGFTHPTYTRRKSDPQTRNYNRDCPLVQISRG